MVGLLSVVRQTDDGRGEQSRHVRRGIGNNPIRATSRESGVPPSMVVMYVAYVYT
jgi:hypothetical protein